MRTNPIKQLLKEGKPAIGTWMSLGSITAARFMARTGFDWLTIDVEHSLVNIETTTHLMASIADAGCVPLARVPSNSHENIKRILDNGGHGVVVPMVNTRAEAELAVKACLYPPVGNRSVGGNVHALNWGANASEYYAKVDQEVLIVLQCEHIDAVNNFDDVFGVPGVDAVFVGPNDLSASMRDANGNPPAPDVFQAAINSVLAGCKRLGIAAGIHAFSAENAHERVKEGWQFIAINSELKMMVDNATEIVRGFKGDAAGDLAKY